MGETAKILNPHKQVLIPGPLTGCSLADSITVNQIEELHRIYQTILLSAILILLKLRRSAMSA